MNNTSKNTVIIRLINNTYNFIYYIIENKVNNKYKWKKVNNRSGGLWPPHLQRERVAKAARPLCRLLFFTFFHLCLFLLACRAKINCPLLLHRVGKWGAWMLRFFLPPRKFARTIEDRSLASCRSAGQWTGLLNFNSLERMSLSSTLFLRLLSIILSIKFKDLFLRSASPLVLRFLVAGDSSSRLVSH